jgi:DNA-binding HxlR family transcriptional regulator
MGMTKKAAKKNDSDLVLESPLSAAINVIGGKWKTIILYMLSDKTLRFGELKKSIPKITQKMLTQQLRELEADGLVTRVAYSEIPPRVEYSLTDYAKELGPILGQLCEWGSRLK